VAAEMVISSSGGGKNNGCKSASDMLGNSKKDLHIKDLRRFPKNALRIRGTWQVYLKSPDFGRLAARPDAFQYRINADKQLIYLSFFAVVRRLSGLW
jgi:hypothetical protein